MITSSNVLTNKEKKIIKNAIVNKAHSYCKWPQCIISGDKVTEEQALDIIKRTDDFYVYPIGNNRVFIKMAMEALKIPQETPIKDTDTAEEINKKFETDINNKEKYFKKNKIIAQSISYLKNSYISSCFIAGYCGWVHTDGTIGYSFNIGKWPTAKEIVDDLFLFGENFPYLKMFVTIMDNENDYATKSLDTYILDHGQVHLLEEPIPIEELDLTIGQEYAGENELDMDFVTRILSNASENKFSIEELKSWNMVEID